MGIAQLIALAAFCLPFLFVYRLLVKSQAGERRYGRPEGAPGDGPL